MNKQPQTQTRIPTKKWNPALIIKISRAINELIDPDLGRVKYCTLKFDDVLEIAKYTSPLERSLHTLFRMLKAPANPGLTLETIKLLPADVAQRLLSNLQDLNVFLPVEPKQVAEAIALSKGEIKASNTGEEHCKTNS